MNRRSFLRAAPAAVAAAPTVAKSILDGAASNAMLRQTAEGMVGYGLAGVNAVSTPADWAKSELRNLLQRRAEHKEGPKVEPSMKLHMAAARIDSLRSVSVETRARLAVEARARFEAEQELSFIDRRIADLKREFPLLAAVVGAAE